MLYSGNNNVFRHHYSSVRYPGTHAGPRCKGVQAVGVSLKEPRSAG